MHTIRLATKADSAAILEIYAPYISQTAVSFETEVPSVEEFTKRIGAIAERYPYLVYVADGVVAGYAYASMHSERNAYRYDAEVSIYVSQEYHGAGVAQRLYGCLFAILKELGYVNLYAGCTVPNAKSMGFHLKNGFTLVGTYHKTGYKFGKWHDVAWYEKTLGEHGGQPGAVKSVRELPGGYLEALFSSYTE